MAQSPAERRRAQRQLAKELREQRAGRATRQRGAAGRAYRREIERRDLPVFRQERQRIIGGGPSEGPRTPPGGGGGIDLQEMRDGAVRNARWLFGTDNPLGEASLKFKPRSFRSRLDAHAGYPSIQELEAMSNADVDEWIARAQIQANDDGSRPTELIRDMGFDPNTLGWFDDAGNWHNLWWYH